jgi:hypothetical protein
MRMKREILAALCLIGVGAPATAQDLERAEIMVTAQRIDQDDYSSEMPAVGLRRSADFLVQNVIIRGDTRDEKQRRAEIREMLAKAVNLAGANGVELAFGTYILTPLTMANIDEIVVRDDNRPDSERVDFLVKARLGTNESGTAAQQRISRYVDAVPEVGRAQMDESGDATLSVIGPDSYRGQIADKIGEDARAMATRMGDGYAIEVEGLNMPVQWTRSGASEVLLYIPYKLRVVPKP